MNHPFFSNAYEGLVSPLSDSYVRVYQNTTYMPYHQEYPVHHSKLRVALGSKLRVRRPPLPRAAKGGPPLWASAM